MIKFPKQHLIQNWSMPLILCYSWRLPLTACDCSVWWEFLHMCMDIWRNSRAPSVGSGWFKRRHTHHQSHHTTMYKGRDVHNYHRHLHHHCQHQNFWYRFHFHLSYILIMINDHSQLLMYRKLKWLWTYFHYFHKYLHNDELNSRFQIEISNYHVRATPILNSSL